MAESFSHGEKENSLGIAESRVHPRTVVRALAYVELSDENAGLILNISEDGLAVQAVQVVASDHLPRMRFRLPKTDLTIEVAGKMVWQLRSRKEVGIQFVDLSEAARAHIQEWIAAEPSRLAAPPEPLRRRTPQPEKPSRSSPLEAEHAVSVPAMEPEAPLEPVVFVPPTSIPPSPAEPRLPADEVTLNVSPAGAPPRSGEYIRPPAELPDTLPQPVLGSFPLGRMSVPDLRRAEPPTVNMAGPSAFPEGSFNQLAWKAPAAPAMTREPKKARRWWTYAAALGIIAALGFAALVMIDPDVISRPRVATVSQAPSATAAPESPSPQQTAPTDGPGNGLEQQTPQRLPGSGDNGKASRGRGGVGQPIYSPPTSQARPPVIVNPLAPANSLASHRDEAPASGASTKPSQDQSARQANGSLPTVQPNQTQTHPASNGGADCHCDCVATSARAGSFVESDACSREPASDPAKGSGRVCGVGETRPGRHCGGKSKQGARPIPRRFAEHTRFACGAQRTAVGSSERFGGRDFAISRDSDSTRAEGERFTARRQFANRPNAIELFAILSD